MARKLSWRSWCDMLCWACYNIKCSIQLGRGMDIGNQKIFFAGKCKIHLLKTEQSKAITTYVLWLIAIPSCLNSLCAHFRCSWQVFLPILQRWAQCWILFPTVTLLLQVKKALVLSATWRKRGYFVAWGSNCLGGPGCTTFLLLYTARVLSMWSLELRAVVATHLPGDTHQAVFRWWLSVTSTWSMVLCKFEGFSIFFFWQAEVYLLLKWEDFLRNR